MEQRKQRNKLVLQPSEALTSAPRHPLDRLPVSSPRPNGSASKPHRRPPTHLQSQPLSSSPKKRLETALREGVDGHIEGGVYPPFRQTNVTSTDVASPSRATPPLSFLGGTSAVRGRGMEDHLLARVIKLEEENEVIGRACDSLRSLLAEKQEQIETLRQNSEKKIKEQREQHAAIVAGLREESCHWKERAKEESKKRGEESRAAREIAGCFKALLEENRSHRDCIKALQESVSQLRDQRGHSSLKEGVASRRNGGDTSGRQSSGPAGRKDDNDKHRLCAQGLACPPPAEGKKKEKNGGGVVSDGDGLLSEDLDGDGDGGADTLACTESESFLPGPGQGGGIQQHASVSAGGG
eukprot:Cvel_28354.t1-p1 / transcript=Cvel_28354.t1 / gene=Cvel_28354 / organism=Chromera_velia_CCMP2878 / gene_product=hypothetical protein / transcript_product=hypothetical protein / location=Cvel_scaffold3692:1-2841(-) / protein_length=352 / sequence_SO=supercontig / SO=protein_coding / is_pseudo=false